MGRVAAGLGPPADRGRGAPGGAGPRTIAIAAGLWRPRAVDTVVATVLWVHANTRRAADRSAFLERTAEELAAERTPTGCIDYTVLTAAILRAAGLRAKFVHGVRVTPAGESRGQGHAFLQLDLDGQRYLLDPTKGRLYAGYDSRNPNLPDGYVVQFKGHDVWSQGIRTEDVLLGVDGALRQPLAARLPRPGLRRAPPAAAEGREAGPGGLRARRASPRAPPPRLTA